MNRHHLTPRSRGGENLESNLILIKIERHNAWHRFWGNANLKEILFYLSHCSNKQFKHNKDWQKIWGNKTTRKVIAILLRLQSIKSYQRFMYSFLYE